MNRLCSNCGSKWLPNPISSLESVVAFNGSFNGIASIKKNICYNLQYTEYVHQCLEEQNLTGVLVTQNFKMFIIVSSSIIESILYTLIKIKGLQKMSSFSMADRKSLSGVKVPGCSSTQQIEIVINEKVPPFELEMTFTDLIKIAKKNSVLPSFTHYGMIDQLRKLRNRIHLHAVERTTSANDTDWKNFNTSDYDIARKTLYRTLVAAFRLDAEQIKIFEYLL